MVAELASVTVTCGRADPPGSVTAPAKAPVVADWPCDGEGNAVARTLNSRTAAHSLRGSGCIGNRIVARGRTTSSQSAAGFTPAGYGGGPFQSPPVLSCPATQIP